MYRCDRLSPRKRIGREESLNLYKISVENMAKKQVSLGDYKGKVLLIVNTASKCGFTPQFKELEALYQAHKAEDFMILGFPCNQFKEQDPESNEEILSFCQLNYGVTFPMLAKIEVNGANEAPLYTYLKAQQGGMFNKEIKWNFTKFLVNRSGEVVGRYGPTTKPSSMEKEIKALL